MGQFLRIVLLLIVIWIVVRLIRRALAGRSHTESTTLPPPADMLRCDYCGVYVPRHEAISVRGKSYCSGSHADADRAGS